MMIFFSTVVGSTARGTSLDSSLKDKFTVFVKTEEELKANTPNEYINKNSREICYEISAFFNNLKAGHLPSHLAMWTPVHKMNHFDSLFNLLSNVKQELTNKAIMNRWLAEAKYYYERSLRLGSLVKQNLSVLDFMLCTKFSYGASPIRIPLGELVTSGLPSRIGDIITKRPIKEEHLSLVKTEDPNEYYLYETYNSSKPVEYIRGIIDDNGDIVESNMPERDNLPSGTSCIGMVKYKKAEHQKYKSLVRLLNESSVKHGYSTKSAYFAFRNLSVISSILEDYRIPELCNDRSFILRIRKGEVSKEQLDGEYRRRSVQVENRMNQLHLNYDEPIQVSILDEILVKARNKANTIKIEKN